MTLAEQFRAEKIVCCESAVPVWERAAEMAEQQEKQLRQLIADLRRKSDAAKSHSEVSAVHYCYSYAADRLAAILDGKEQPK